MSKKQGPDFLCIGTQKSGTSWLYENLAMHKDVWMPILKEFHYFNRVCINDQLLGDWNIPHPGGLKRYVRALKKFDLKQLKWLLRYYELGMERNWYLSLFDEKYTGGKIIGDITPGYSTLEERGVKYASEVLAKDIPVILIIRNPIHRSWSAAKMMIRYRSQSAENVAVEEILDLLDTPAIRLCSEYSRMIPLWRKYFKNFYVLSYDELCDTPRSFLTKISQILSISNDWNDQIIDKRVWSDETNIQMPPAVLNALITQYSSEIEVLTNFDECECAKTWHRDVLRLSKDTASQVS